MYEFLQYQAQDVMTRDPVTITGKSSLRELSDCFAHHDFNGVPVVDDRGEIVGIATKFDLLRAFDFDDEHMFPPYEEIMDRRVDSVMTTDIRLVRPRTPLPRVLHAMVERSRKSFPVLDGRRLVGIVSREDVLRGLARAAQGLEPESIDDRL